MLQCVHGMLGAWVHRAQRTLLRGQRGREEGHGLRRLALLAERDAECAG